MLLHTISPRRLLWNRGAYLYLLVVMFIGSSSCLLDLGSLGCHQGSQDCHHQGMAVHWGCLLGREVEVVGCHQGNQVGHLGSQGYHLGRPGLGSLGNLGYHLDTPEVHLGSQEHHLAGSEEHHQGCSPPVGLAFEADSLADHHQHVVVVAACYPEHAEVASGSGQVEVGGH